MRSYGCKYLSKSISLRFFPVMLLILPTSLFRSMILPSLKIIGFSIPVLCRPSLLLPSNNSSSHFPSPGSPQDLIPRSLRSFRVMRYCGREATFPRCIYGCCKEINVAKEMDHHSSCPSLCLETLTCGMTPSAPTNEYVPSLGSSAVNEMVVYLIVMAYKALLLLGQFLCVLHQAFSISSDPVIPHPWRATSMRTFGVCINFPEVMVPPTDPHPSSPFCQTPITSFSGFSIPTSHPSKKPTNSLPD